MLLLLVPQGRVFLCSGFIRISCLITSVNCLWRRPVVPRPILVFPVQPFPEELHGFSCSWSTKRDELSSWPWWLLVDVEGSEGWSCFSPISYTSLWLCPPSQASWLLTSLKLHFGRDTNPVRSVVCIFGLVCKSMPCMRMRVWEIRRKIRGKCPCVQGCNW